MNYLIKLGKKLFPLNRSLTGPGNVKTLKILQKEIPLLKIKKFVTGRKVYDWKIPKEWIVKDAYIKDKNEKKIIDFKNNNLHLVSYSIPIKKKIKLSKLVKKFHYYKKQPNAIPYITSYYNEDWGFCLSYNQLRKIKKKYNGSDEFEIVINSTFKRKGFMHYGELVIPGKSKKEVLISVYICHPSMANNELSGPLLAVALYKYFRKKKLKKTLRIVFLPETIGAIAYINKNFKKLKEKVEGGYVLTCIGDNRSYSYLETKYGNSPSDIAAKKALEELKINYTKYSFLDRGSDERQYNSPIINLNIGSIMRTKYGKFKEYHSSLDNFKLVSSEGLRGGYKVVKKAILNLMNLKIKSKKIKIIKNYFKSRIICEPQLGKRNLYPSIGVKDKNFHKSNHKQLLDFLQYCDGTNSITQISKKINLSLKKSNKILQILKRYKLVY